MITLGSYGQDVQYKGRGSDSTASNYLTLEHRDSGDKIRLALSDSEIQKLISFINSVPVDSAVRSSDEALMDEAPTVTDDGSGEFEPPPAMDLDQGAEAPESQPVEIPDTVFPKTGDQ